MSSSQNPVPLSPIVVIIGPVWPEPRSSAAGWRSLGLIRAFREAGWEVHFASAAKVDEHAEALRAQGVHAHPVAMNHASFDSWIAALRPRIVVFERFMTEEQFGWRVREHSPRSLRVLDTIDLHFLRRARQRALRSGHLDLLTEDAFREVAAIHRSDCALMISEFETALLTDGNGPFRVPADQLVDFGFCYDPAPPPVGYEARAGFAMIGNFRHEPNADAVRWLKSEIWPAIRARLPAAEVQVYGAYPSREIMALTDERKGFWVRGPAKDQYEALAKARVNLAPLRFGAGLKGKVSDGWWVGTPCAATSVAAEGMRAHGSEEEASFGGLVADDPAGFAAAAVKLHVDPAVHHDAARRGDRILRERFSHLANGKKVVAELESRTTRIEESRRENFVGQMLAHHFHQSTRYFSRWIELKERLAAGG